jgi:hypothetical protein
VSIAGNFRVAAITTLFFIITAMITYCHPTANREAWPIKVLLFLCAVAATIVIPNEPYFTPLYFVIAIGTLLLLHVHNIILVTQNRSILTSCFVPIVVLLFSFGSWWCHFHMSTTNRHP